MVQYYVICGNIMQKNGVNVSKYSGFTSPHYSCFVYRMVAT